jgi:hypothetical protein
VTGFGGLALPLAALIILGDYAVGERPPMLIRFAGQTLLERCIRQLNRAGANHIVLLVSAVPADVVGVVDKMAREGVSIDLARDAADAADRIHPDETLLIVDGPMILAQSWYDRLRDADRDTVITVARSALPSGAEDRFERIDGADHWLGLARIDGALLRIISAELGDWALGPTLLRKALQSGVARLAYDGTQEALASVRPLSITDVMVAHDVPRSDGPKVDGWFTTFVQRMGMSRLARFIAWQNISFSVVEYAAMLLFSLVIVLALYAYSGLAALFYVAGAYTRQLAHHSAVLAIGGPSIGRALRWGAVASFLAIPASMAWFYDGGFGAFGHYVLALWMISAWLLLRQARAHRGVTSPWHSDAAGLAFILAIGSFTGFPLIGMGVVIVLLIVEHALHQNMQSRFPAE